GVHDTLEHQVARPQPAKRLNVGPQQRRRRLAGNKIGNLVSARAGWCVLLPIAEQRQAALEIVAHPSWMQAGLELGRPPPVGRARETVTQIALALGVDGYVNSDDKRAETGIARSSNLVLGDLAILGNVELIPAVLRRDPGQILERASTGARHD